VKRIDRILKEIDILCVLTFSIIIMVGCDSKFPSQFENDSYDYLNLRTSGDDPREIMLTDLSGGFFFSGVSDDSGKAVFGYSRFDKHLISGWDVSDDMGGDLRSEVKYCIIKPQYIERHFQSGLIETIRTPLYHQGLIVTIEGEINSSSFFKPIFDFRILDSEFPEKIHAEFEIERKIPLIVRSDNTEFGCIAIAASNNPEVIRLNHKQIVNHPLSYSIGRPSDVEKTTFGEFELKSGGKTTIVFGWGETPESAGENALNILKNSRKMKKERERWIHNVLSRVDLKIDNVKFQKCYAFAKLQLAGMNFSDTTGTYLHTALPYSPFPDGWFTAISSPGIAELYNSADSSLDMISSILQYQDRDTSSIHYGMLPGKIFADSIEYRVPFITGLVSRAYRSIKSRFLLSDSTYDLKLKEVYLHDNIGTRKFRTTGKIYSYSGANAHFLWDSPAAPERQGYTYESELFASDIMMKSYRDEELEQVPSELKPEVEQGRGRSGSRTSITGAKDYVMRYAEKQMAEDYAAGIELQYDSDGKIKQYITRDSLTGYYTYTRIIEDNVDITTYPIKADTKPFNMTDYINQQLRVPLKIEDGFDYYHSEMTDIETSMTNRSPQMTQRIVQPFVQSWLMFMGFTPDDILRRIDRSKIAGQTGLRSLGKYEEGYQPQHQYHMDSCPYGTTSKGDVLVWTAGCLGDLYLNDGSTYQYFKLCEALSAEIIESGVIGGLPEAMDAEVFKNGNDYVWSPVHSTSLAEYIRLISQGMLTVQYEDENTINFKPEIPKDYGNYRIEHKYSNGRFWIEKYKSTIWQVGQEDIEPYLKLTIDIRMPSHGNAKHTLRIYPGECIQVKFESSNEYIWKAEQRPWSAREQEVELWGLPDK